MCPCPYHVSPLALLIFSYVIPLDCLPLPFLWSSLQMSLSYNNGASSIIQWIEESKGQCISILYLLLCHLASVSLGYFLVNKTHFPRLGAKWMGPPGLLKWQWQTWVCEELAFDAVLVVSSFTSQGCFLLECFSLMVWKKGYGLRMLILLLPCDSMKCILLTSLLVTH